jgi:alpha-glucoside transport system substrate-binding protein
MATRMDWRRQILGLGAVLILSLAACGQAEVPSPTAQTTTGTQPTDDGAPPGLSGEIRVVHAWAGAEGEAFQAVVDGFTAQHSDATVTLVQVPFDELNSQMIQQFAAGTPPDVVSSLPGLIRTLAAEDKLMSLDDVWDQWVADGEYTDSLRQIASADGTAYGVWFKGNVNGLIWHRTDTLAELGLGEPATWDDFLAMLDQIQSESDLQPFAVGASDVWVPTQWNDAVLAKVIGPDKFNGLIDGSISWDDPDVVRAYEIFSEVIQTYWPADALNVGFTDANCQWASEGLAVFQNQGAFVNLTTPANCGEDLDPETDFTFFEMPAPDDEFSDVRFVSGDLFSVARDSANPDLAKEFARYLGSAEAQSIWASRGGFIAPNADTDPSVYPTENDRKAADLFTSGRAVYDLDDAIGGEIQTVEREELKNLIRTGDVQRFIEAMVEVTERVRGG